MFSYPFSLLGCQQLHLESNEGSHDALWCLFSSSKMEVQMLQIQDKFVIRAIIMPKLDS